MPTLRERVEDIVTGLEGDCQKDDCADEGHVNCSVKSILQLFTELAERLGKAVDRVNAYGTQGQVKAAARAAMLDCIKDFKEGL